MNGPKAVEYVFVFEGPERQYGN